MSAARVRRANAGSVSKTNSRFTSVSWADQCKASPSMMSRSCSLDSTMLVWPGVWPGVALVVRPGARVIASRSISSTCCSVTRSFDARPRPPRSIVITIDDGFESVYTTAWPMLKEFGYPFTVYVNTQFVNTGAKSMSWKQLAELRDAGVDIACHSYSHDNMSNPKRRPRTMTYAQWLNRELVTSNAILGKRLGVDAITFETAASTTTSSASGPSDATEAGLDRALVASLPTSGPALPAGPAR